MPRLFRHIDDVALIGEEDRQRADTVANLPLENEPELRPLQVEVPFVARVRLLWLAADDIRDRAIVRDETARRLSAGDDGVEIDIRLFAPVVSAFSADADLHEIEAG